MTFGSKYIKIKIKENKNKIVLLSINNFILCYEDFKNDMFMNMLQLLRLHSIELVRLWTINLISGLEEHGVVVTS